VLLVEALRRAGFDDVRLATRDRWMLEVDARRRVEGDERPLAVGWLGGAYDEEGEPPEHWRWTDGRPALLLVAQGGGPLRVAVRAALRCPAATDVPVRITVSGEEARRPLAVGDVEVPWRRVLTVGDDPVRIVFEADAEPVHAPGDVRTLVLQLARPAIDLVAPDEPDETEVPVLPAAPAPSAWDAPAVPPGAGDAGAPPPGSPLAATAARAVRGGRHLAGRARQAARARLRTDG
jgi:hypothetical protein